MPGGDNKSVKEVKEQNLSHDKIWMQATLQTIVVGGEEISLYVPPADAVQEAYKRGEIPFPFWSKIWPAAIALANYLELYPHLTHTKKVLELGAGLGLPSFIAAQTAADVLCTDHAPEAVQLAERSAKHLGLQNFRAAVLDWHHLPPDLEADVLLLSDINYEPAVFAALMKLIDDFLQKGTTIILSTPQRLMAKDFINPLLAAAISNEEVIVKSNGEDIAIALLVLKRE